MKLNAVAGSLISCDLLVEIELNDNLTDNEIIIESPSIIQYGKKMKEITYEEIIRNGLKKFVRIKIVDKGALDYVLRARLQTAFNRIGKMMIVGENDE
ncbi:citrate lyase acyl carrier protein [bacterium]|nr:citrate lyase acyl carrier protein [bacterium]